jgi:hypothetical protein
MDHYTPERLFLDRMREVTEAAERHARLNPAPAGAIAPRVWIAGRLRALADRLDGRFDEERRLLQA